MVCGELAVSNSAVHILLCTATVHLPAHQADQSNQSRRGGQVLDSTAGVGAHLELLGLLILPAEFVPPDGVLRRLFKPLVFRDLLAILYGSTLWALGGARRTAEGPLGVAPGVVDPGRRGIPERGVGMRLLLALLLR